MVSKKKTAGQKYPADNPLNEFINGWMKADQYILSHLKDMEITKNDFKIEIQQLLENYYEIKIDEVVNNYTHAEFLQACAILFYETCAHAMIIKDFKPN